MADDTKTRSTEAGTGAAGRYQQLPERIRLEDTVATVGAEAPADPTMGRDPERDVMLRNAG